MGGGCSRGIAVVDLNECDREPIQIPGTVQPFGVLFALDEEMKVTQVSENVSDHLSLRVDEVLGRPLSESVDPAGAEEVRSVLREQRWHDANPLTIDACGKRFDGIVHQHEGAAILELEPNPETPEEHSFHHPFRAALLRLQRASTLSELAAIITQEMRRTTGFERVMFYRFHEDGSGSVDAEAREAAHEPYLGLHYPASDIPAQARRLYLKNWLRLIFDADQKPARIVPALRPDTGAPLDLSFSVLRSVSPIHIEYMKNMGVRASMSISLIVRNRLWGLISCLNHSGPRRVSHQMRSACEFMGRLASLQIAAFEDRELLASRASRRATEDALHRAMQESTGSVLTALFAQPRALIDLVDAGGVAVVENGEPVTCGDAPPADVIREIARWLEARGDLQALLFRFTWSPLSAGARGERSRKWPAHVRAARRSADVVPPGGHPDGELGRRSNQARRCGGRQAPAPAPLVRPVEGGGARPLPSVDGSGRALPPTTGRTSGAGAGACRPWLDRRPIHRPDDLRADPHQPSAGQRERERGFNFAPRAPRKVDSK